MAEAFHHEVGGLAMELLLRIASFLTWHQTRAFWSVLPMVTDSTASSDKAWLALVAARTASFGHEEAFLADLTTLKDAKPYQPLLAAYTELFPSVVKSALAHRYSPNRMLEHVFATDDAALLRLLFETHRFIHLEPSTLTNVVDRRARQCLEVILAEAAKGEKAHVRLEVPRQPQQPQSEAASFPPLQRSNTSSKAVVDFDRYPQRLLWRAALTRDSKICKLVLNYLAEGSKLAADYDPEAFKLQRWAACCGAACGQSSLLAFCGPLLADEVARVSFKVTTDSRYGQEELEFTDAPLAVVAALRGHAQAVETMARSGADMMLCTSRGLTALDAARHPEHSAELRAKLESIILAPPGTLPPLSVRGSRPGSRIGSRPGSSQRRSRSSASIGGGEGLALALAAASAAAAAARMLNGTAAWEAEPMEAAVRRGDVKALRSLVSRGARLQQSDLMAAVNSGDLDMLAIVQQECQGADGTVEYRKMMRQTAAQIRADRREIVEADRRRSESLPRPSSGSGALRRAGESSLRLPAIGAGRKFVSP